MYDVVYNTTKLKLQYCKNGIYIDVPAQSGGGSGSVVSITAGSGLSGGTITSSGTISMPNIGFAGTYGNSTQYPIITTDTQGRVSNVTLQTIPTTGISINGQTGSSQTFANAFSGLTPNFTSALNVHTLNIPLASTPLVTSGTISNSEYQSFVNNWGLDGNSIVTNLNFIGSINNQSLRFRTNNVERMLLDVSGNLGVGISPTERLHISGNIRYNGALMPNNLSGSIGQVLVSNGVGLSNTWSNISFGNIGVSPNAQGASSSGTSLTLQPASSSFGGVVTTSAQTFSGSKTFNSNITVSGTTLGNKVNSGNILFGAGALNVFSSGAGNTAIGSVTLASMTTGSYNIAIGQGAIQNGVNPVYNIALGWNALVPSNGQKNIGIGCFAGQNVSSGESNILIGYAAGGSITTGSYNTLIGNAGLFASTNTSNNVALADGQGNIRFWDDNINTKLPRLAGIGTRMVVAGVNGELSTQSIPSGGSSINFSDEEIPSGTIDGINNIFVFANTPVSGSLKLYIRGSRLKSGVDYTITGATITITASTWIPSSGDPIFADYRY